MTLLLALSAAFAGTCTEIDAGDVLSVPPPAVIVLGERPGVGRDDRRATRIARQLRNIAPVTVALETAPQALQPVLDRYGSGDIATEHLEEELDWELETGLPYGPYSGLLTGAVDDLNVVAVGSRSWHPPSTIDVPVSPAYLDVLRDTMGAGEMPRAAESDFLQFVAWRDHELARRSLASWDGRGYLVILTHRNRIEGGFGVPWQLGGQTEATVASFVLGWGEEPPCYDGDRVWKETFLEKLFGG